MGMTLLVAAAIAARLAEPIVLPAPAAVEGIVVDAGGHLVAGAEVWSQVVSFAAQADRLEWQGTADAEGRFRMERGRWFAAGEPPGMGYESLHAYREGMQVGGTRVGILETPTRDRPLRLVLRKGPGLIVRVLGPGGKPVGEAKVRVMSGGNVGSLADGQSRRLAVTTDLEGRAVLAAFEPESLRPFCSLEVATTTYGVQRWTIDMENEAELTLRLLPVGRVSGRVIADNPARARGVTVRAASRRPFVFGETLVSGDFTGTTDADGRFEIPALADGRLSFFMPRPSPELVPVPPLGRMVEAGGRVEVEIPLKAGIPVRGSVVETASRRPVVGVSLLISSRAGGAESVGPFDVTAVRTDAAGRFVANMRPGRIDFQVRYTGPYVTAATTRPDAAGAPLATLPEGSPGIDLPPIELVHGVDVRGIVRDEGGRPLPDARVEAMTDGGRRTGPAIPGPPILTDERGEFVLRNATPGVPLELTAWHGDAASGRATPVMPSATRPVELAVSPQNTLGLGGRVVDERGRPVAGARVTIRSRGRTSTGAVATRFPSFDTGLWLRTGADGRFRTPRALLRHEEHQAVVTAPGWMRAETAWYAATTPSFFDVVVFATPPPDEATIRKNYDAGWAASRRGNYDEADAKFAEAVKEAESRKLGTPLDQAWWLMGRAEALFARGKYAECEAYARRALLLRMAALGLEHAEVADSQLMIGAACGRLAKFDDAEESFRDALGVRARLLGEDHPSYGDALARLGQFEAARDRHAEARAHLARALTVIETALGRDAPELIAPMNAQAYVLIRLGRLDEAEAILRRALPMAQKNDGLRSANAGESRRLLVWILRGSGRGGEADALEALARPGPEQ